MDIDDAAVRAWVPALAEAASTLPADRRTWRINRSGVRGLLAASSAGLTWSEHGGLVTRPFTDVASLELVGLNGVVLHVHGLLPARLTFPDVRDRDAFEQVLHAQRSAVPAPAPVSVPQPVPQPVATAAPPVYAAPAPVPAAPVAPVAVAPVPVTARGRSGPSPFGPPTVRAVVPPAPPAPPSPPSPPAPEAPEAPVVPVPPARPQPARRASSHPPSSSRLRAARLAEERRAGQAPSPEAALEAPRGPQRPPSRPVAATAEPRDELATSRLRDGLVFAGFLAGVGVLLAIVSGQSASQSVQSTGSDALTYVGYGLVVLGAVAALVTVGRASLGGRR